MPDIWKNGTMEYWIVEELSSSIVQGRTWRLEIDERLDSLKRWCTGKMIVKNNLRYAI